MGCSSSTSQPASPLKPPPRPAPVLFPLCIGTVPPDLPFVPDSALRWQLVSSMSDFPSNAFRIGTYVDGEPEFAARARMADGSVRPGRVVASLRNGCSVAFDNLALTVSAFEVLLGSAQGYDIHVVPWADDVPPPPSAVVAGVSTRGDPLLMAVTDHLMQSPTTGAMQNVQSVGYTSARSNQVNVGMSNYNRRMNCCGRGCGVITAVASKGIYGQGASGLATAPGGGSKGESYTPTRVGVVYAAGERAHDGGFHVIAARLTADSIPTSKHMSTVVDWARYQRGDDIKERAESAIPSQWDVAGERGGDSGIADIALDSSWGTVSFGFGPGGLSVTFENGVDYSLRGDEPPVWTVSPEDAFAPRPEPEPPTEEELEEERQRAGRAIG